MLKIEREIFKTKLSFVVSEMYYNYVCMLKMSLEKVMLVLLYYYYYYFMRVFCF